jgi:protein CpxP
MKSVKSSFSKQVLAGLIAGGSILAAAAYAMPDGAGTGKPGCEARQGQQTQSGWQAQRAKRMAALKEKLKLAPAQEAAWDKFVEATRPGAQPIGADRQAMRDEFQKLNTVERLDKMLALSEVRRARMAERAEAIKAFYTQLSPEQQGVFDAELKAQRQQHMPQRRVQS